MKTVALLLAVAFVGAACADQNPSAPGSRTASGSIAADAVPSNQLRKASGKPTDQVGFTKVSVEASLDTKISAGQVGGVSVKCPVGTVAISASHTLDIVHGTRPLIQGLQPTFDNTTPTGYLLTVDNSAAGAADVGAMLFVTCIS